MTNKIHGYTQQPQVSVDRGNRANSTDGVARGDNKPVAPAVPARDSVSVSDTALLLQKLEEKVASTPPSNAEHVRQIKEALARNEYVVDPQKIADKMLKVEREFDRKQQQ